MSVILFSKQEIEQLYALIEFHLDKIKPIIRSSPYYAQFVRYEEKCSGTLKLPFEEDRCETQFIQSVLYYAAVSNWVAYAAQYRETVDFKKLGELDFSQLPPKANTLKYLIGELRHFYYNMNTNDGNFFIDNKWYNPFIDILNDLAYLVCKG